MSGRISTGRSAEPARSLGASREHIDKVAGDADNDGYGVWVSCQQDDQLATCHQPVTSIMAPGWMAGAPQVPNGDVGPRPFVPAIRTSSRAFLFVPLMIVLLAGCSQAPSSGERASDNGPTQPTSTPYAEHSPPEEHSRPEKRTHPKDDLLPVDLADITRIHVIHRQPTAVVRVTLADATKLWKCAMGSGDYFDIYLDTNGDRKHEREIFIPWACGAADVMKYIEDGGETYCRVQPSVATSGNSFTLLIPARCLGSPPGLRARAYVYSDHNAPGRLSRYPGDLTDWTPLAAVGEATSVADPVGDTSPRVGA